MYSALFGIQCTCALPTTSAVSDNNVSKDPRPPSIPPSICTTLKPSSPDIYCTVCSPPQLSLSDNNFRKCPLCTIFFVSSTLYTFHTFCSTASLSSRARVLELSMFCENSFSIWNCAPSDPACLHNPSSSAPERKKKKKNEKLFELRGFLSGKKKKKISLIQRPSITKGALLWLISFMELYWVIFKERTNTTLIKKQ